MKKSNLQKSKILAELESGQTITGTAKKLNLDRKTIYRWTEEDADFAEQVEKAKKLGEEFRHDMATNSHMFLLGKKFWPAVKYQLEKRDAKENVGIKNQRELAKKEARKAYAAEMENCKAETRERVLDEMEEASRREEEEQEY